MEPIYSVMIGALAVADTLGDVLAVETELKWPNDVLICKRKVCGILAESSRQAGIDRVVVGIGLNVNAAKQSSAGFPTDAATLEEELGTPVDREELTVALFNRLDLWYGKLTEDPGLVFRAWSSRLEVLGSPVLVREATGDWTGIATDVQLDGALVVRDERGDDRAVYAADVTIRNPEDCTGPDTHHTVMTS